MGASMHRVGHRLGMAIAPIGQANLARSQGKVPQAFARFDLTDEEAAQCQGHQVQANVEAVLGALGPRALDRTAIHDDEAAFPPRPQATAPGHHRGLCLGGVSHRRLDLVLSIALLESGQGRRLSKISVQRDDESPKTA
jgi:hypothetical protein